MAVDSVDYLKTYLGIDPDDYSAMEARIRGEEPQAQAPAMMRQPMMMPQQRSLGEMEAMPMAPRPQPKPQVDDRYQSLMDEIASLKAQIEGMQAPTEQAPVMADEPTEINMEDAREMFYQSPEFKDYQERTKGMAHDMAYRPQTYTDPVTGKTVSFQDRSGLFQDWYKKTYGRDLSMNSGGSGSLDSSLGGFLDQSKRIQARNPDGTPMTGSTGQEVFFNDDGTIKNFQAPPELQNRMVEEPQPIPQAPSQDIQASIDYLAKLPKMNIPQIPDIEQIRQKMEEANMTFPEPVSYQDQLQAIKDLPPMTQMPQQMPQQKSGGIFGNLLSRVQKQVQQPQMPQQKSSGIFGNLSNLVKKQVQQPQMQSVGRPQLPFQGGFMPEMRADGGGIDKAIYDLKFKLNG